MTIEKYFNADEFSAIDSHQDDAGRRHPVWSAINAKKNNVQYERRPKDYLFHESISSIDRSPNGKAWLNSNLKRVKQKSNHEDSASAIAELLCYGALLQAGFEVTPIKTKNDEPTPDFKVEINGKSCIVEVATKLQHGAQLEIAKAICRGETPSGVERKAEIINNTKLEFVTRILAPFGEPDSKKEGDTIQSNAISKICSIKAKETQVSNDVPSILWIDFRDLSEFSLSLQAEQAMPLISGHSGELCSGAIWYAFYGWKDATIFEDKSCINKTRTKMQHYGRFSLDNPKISKYAAAIICLEKATFIFENPKSVIKLSSNLKHRITLLPWFDLQHSVANWSKNTIELNIEVAKGKLEFFEKNSFTL